ncbi:MAG: carboxylating nicotinate-nucleotide diphosphorylase [Gammaproteobacteria bacterium]|nr:carboxylating nicotinate-nucleotide diphosphorylase [Gammaproteobacteria bacterium]NND38076.1 carboxylating nicotinate-nucleotide diphosphorylase [Pseudomonadales bacterium]NNL10175.1 carboxylating nicotinate-nucleotide diphosphorylase [Pseudomonadales bacterium]NNM11132.1 carboxylating nicotinate-nucleotide diphosphorylase [Pseudomonadales bacterium]RZV58861.1 MAG: carboxylating nicotinate-nucleotide diphosphorylase [Pseudomonadales bacterium]
MQELQLQQAIQDNVEQALAEDIGDGDISAALIDADKVYATRVIVREPAVICGRAWVESTFLHIDSSVELEFSVEDGDSVNAGDTLFTATGNARSILTAERTALNFLQLLSGTATISRSYADAVAGTKTRVLDTRKTLPGLRIAQKYAVQCGGCSNHRIGLYDAYLIKENHIAACGSISAAIARARQLEPDKRVEIEVENSAEFAKALEAGADIIMLDDFSLADMRKAVQQNQGRAKLEASGSMSLANIREVAETGVDFISVGALTKHLRAIDLSMRFIES